MQSAILLERRTPLASDSEVSDLLVLWQHPRTRAIVPIGRFSRTGDSFVFAYTRAAGAVAGFRPLLGLGDLHGTYRGTKIPAVFNQRVMSPDRPDYEDYIAALGLTAERATPWEQIVESGGRRAGDTLQFMPVPLVNSGWLHTRFLANGVSHISEGSRQLSDRVVSVAKKEQERALSSLMADDAVLLEPEFANAKDPNAIVLTSEGVPLGWVPYALSASLRPLAERGDCWARVHRINGPRTPDHLRLVLNLDIPVPDDFVLDPEGNWEPIGP